MSSYSVLKCAFYRFRSQYTVKNIYTGICIVKDNPNDNVEKLRELSREFQIKKNNIRPRKKCCCCFVVISLSINHKQGMLRKSCNFCPILISLFLPLNVCVFVRKPTKMKKKVLARTISSCMLLEFYLFLFFLTPCT